MKKNSNIIGILCVVMCEMMYGLSYLFTKSATGSASPFTLLGWRFFVALLLLVVLVALRVIKVNFRGKPVHKLLILALFHPVLYFTCETLGIDMTTASESSTIIASVPIVTMIVAALFLKEKPTRAQIAGIVVTVSGVIVTVLAKGGEASFSIFGYAILICGITMFSLFAAFSRKATEFSEFEKTFVMVCSGALVFGIAATVENSINGTLYEMVTLPLKDSSFLTAILYLGTGSSVFAFFLYNKGIALIGTTRSASFVGVSTVVSVILGVLLLSEPFSLTQGIGVVLVLGGVYVANANLNSSKKCKGISSKALDAREFK